MRIVIAVFVMLTVAAEAHAADGRLDWPLRPRPAVARLFDAPAPDWQRGHRGVDLIGSTGQPVYAAAEGVVVFASRLADRSLVSIQHPGGLRTSYEPVDPAVRAGQRVEAGTPIGALVPGHAGCGAPACLHWGAMWGRAADADYVDPLGLVVTTPIRLKPTNP